MRIARVFPRRTKATPSDSLSFRPTDPEGEDYTTAAPGLFPPEVDAVHISVTFTYDQKPAEWLARAWRDVAPVSIGGPACGDKGGEFTPGMYLKRGYLITSRGCPNSGKCWFCKEGPGPRELRINGGWNVLDSNLLACSVGHIARVMAVLKTSPRRPEFTGGIEAARLTPWSAELLRSVRPNRLYMAFDTPDDWEPLVHGAGLLWKAGFTAASHRVCCYVLCGWRKDTMAAADERMRRVASLGLMPYAMLWRDRNGKTDPVWDRFQREWVRPEIVGTKLAEVA